MNRDVSRIRTAMDTGIDPIHVAQSMRNALVSWFGQPGIWAQRSQQLDSMAGPVMEEPSMARLRDDVAQRTAAVQALHDQVRQIEIDLIKQYAYPMARHVSMLLASGEAMPEGAVSKLRSEGDPDDTHGKVFEVRLAGRPLSDGQPAPSLYVHFHTEKVVDTGAIATISPEDLAAVHVKTAEQCGRGKNWESINAAILGPVHRGPLTDQVLLDLQKRMKR